MTPMTVAAAPPEPPAPAPLPPAGTPDTALGRAGRFGSALLIAGGLGALGLLLTGVAPRLGPFWAAAAGAILLWPLRETRAGRAVLLAGGLVLGAYVLSFLWGVLAPFIIVYAVAYMLDPLVVRAERRGVPRWATTAGITLLVVGVVVGGAVVLVPVLIHQVEALAAGAVALARRLPQLASESRVLDRLEAAGAVNRDALLEQLSTVVPQQAQALASRIPALAAMVTKQVGALLGLVTTLVLLPVLLFYTLKDFPRLRGGFVSLLPRVDGRRTYLSEVGRVFGSYLRGQLTISAASAVLVGVPLFLLGVPFSLLLGLAAGLLNLIPSIGSIMTYVLGVGLMLAFGTTADLITVLIVLAVQAVIEQALLTPNIMGKQVDLHPVVILLALFVSGALFGLVGLLLAVPAAALVAGAIRVHRDALVLDVGDDDPTTARV